MRFTNKRRKSKRKIRTRKYIKKGFKGGEGNFGDFTETCLINPFRKAGNVLKDGLNQLNELRKSGNEKMKDDLKTLSLKLSKVSPQNDPLISSIKKQIDKTMGDMKKSDEEVQLLEHKTEDKVESAIENRPSKKLITLGDFKTIDTRGGRKKRLRKSKKKKKRRKKY